MLSAELLCRLKRGNDMNGYEKMKRLRRMKITKAVSAVTALSMTVTGLIVAASANSASPDIISRALGGLTDYGIVARDMTTSSDFESNFAVSNLRLNNSFDVSKFISDKSRTVTFNVTSNETFEDGETKTHYLGVFCGGELVEVEFSGADESSVEKSQIIAVEFTKAGTQTFNITIPDSYKYDTLTIHKLDFVVDEEEKVGTFEICDGGTTLVPFARNEAESFADNAENIIADSLAVENESFGSNKTVYVGPEVYEYITVGDDGRVFYSRNPLYEWGKAEGSDYWEMIPVRDADGNQVYKDANSAPIANNSNTFVLMPEASQKVEELIGSMQNASDTLAQINTETVTDKVLYYEVHGSVHAGSAQAEKIKEYYAYIKQHSDWSLLVNVFLDNGENTYVFNGGAVGDRDLDAASRIVFNFIGGDVKSTHVTLGDGFRGTALAPNARVSIASTICGAVYSPQLAVSSGEVHMATYRAFSHEYWAEYYDVIEVTTTTTSETTTTPPETTTSEEETTTPPETTTSEEETTTPPEEETTTPPETTTSEEETTTPPEEETTTPPETTTSEEETTTPPEEETTTPPETTTSEEETTTPPEEETTTPPETTPPEEETTTPPETTPPEEETTTPPEEETTTPPEETTTTRPRFEVPETTTTTTPPETTTVPPETTTTPPETTTVPPETTTTPPETTTVPPETTTTPPETTTVPPETTTTPPETTTVPPETTTTPPETTTVPPEETTTTTVGVFSDTATTTTTPPPSFEVPKTTPVSETTVPPVTTTTTPTTTVPEIPTETTVTVPVTVRIDEDVPRGAVTPDVPVIMIDERVPLGDRPMNTGVESKVGLFAAIGGAALMIGVGAQVYSVILKKKH